jgi:predicted transcriptional regulator of viral defense system
MGERKDKKRIPARHSNQSVVHDSILKNLERAKLMTHEELAQLGASGMKLRRMALAGQIIAVGSGIYASVSLEPFVAAVHATAKYYPKAVISGLTALQIHGLGQEFIDKVDVDVPRETSIRNKLLKVHRVPQRRIIGVIQMKFQGASIRIYDLERTLCEAFKLDPAGPIFFRALKRYVSAGQVNPKKIQLYDQAARTKVLAHLKQELADA